MILWIILFLLIVAISFVLAFLSMRDYQEIPEESSLEYSLFLIRQPQGFGVSFLDSVGRTLLKNGLPFSIERLFKGQRSALTIYAPKEILGDFSANLNLLELEDYTLSLLDEHLLVWEIGQGNPDEDNGAEGFFQQVAALGPEDQFFWQMVLQAQKQGENIIFKSQIRAAVYSKDFQRRQSLTHLFQDLRLRGLTKVPKPYSREQMREFYHLRTLDKQTNGPVLDSEGVVNLLKV